VSAGELGSQPGSRIIFEVFPSLSARRLPNAGRKLWAALARGVRKHAA